MATGPRLGRDDEQAADGRGLELRDRIGNRRRHATVDAADQRRNSQVRPAPAEDQVTFTRRRFAVGYTGGHRSSASARGGSERRTRATAGHARRLHSAVRTLTSQPLLTDPADRVTA
jgi:hypothetical protein